MKGKIRFSRGLLAMCALSLLMTLPACRKLGLDDTPRVMPNGEMPPVGPKRMPIGQQSGVNTPAAVKSVMTGRASPSPASMASLAPAGDPYAAAYSGNNFWANGAGWSATPPSAPLNAAPPTPQYMPPMAMANPALPPLPSYNTNMQPPYFNAANPFANAAPASPYAPPPQFSSVGSFGMQQTPPAPQQQEFPRLQDTPNSPFYRSQQEIAGDIASLQGQSLGYGWQNTPSFPTSPAGNFSQPVALQDQFMQPPSGYGAANDGYASTMPMPSQLPPQYGSGNNNQWGSPQLAPPPSFNSSPDLFGGQNQQQPQQGYAPPSQNYDSAGFVPPAPIAGVNDMPMQAQDWDRQAYQGQGGGSAYSGNQPLQLQPPQGSGQQNYLPSSRYQGRGAGRGAVPATMDYGGGY